MSRKLKRVPLDFDWELNKIWKGYLNPYYEYRSNCVSCSRTGLNSATRKISDDFYDFADKGTRWSDNITQEEVDHLLSKGRLRTWYDGKWHKFPRTAEEVNQINKGVSLDCHDSINRWYLIEFRAKKQGVYGLCEICNGEGDIWSDKKIDGKLPRELYDNWKSYEPTKGNGYQLWEDVSEGSPISPVFNTIDKLCEWCESNATTFRRNKASKEEWKKMLLDDNVHHKEGNFTFT